MATVESGQFAINLIGSQAQELLLKPIFFDANVEEIFDTMVLVNKKQNLAYADVMLNLLQNTNTRGWTPKGNFAIFDRCIETELVKANVELCYDEFADTVYKQLMKKGTAMDDLAGTIFMDLLLERMAPKNTLLNIPVKKSNPPTKSRLFFKYCAWSIPKTITLKKYPPTIPMESAMIVNAGINKTHAKNRGTTK